MAEFRSKSCRDGRMQITGSYNGNDRAAPTSMQDLRSYSANHTGLQQLQQQNSMNREVGVKMKKGGKNNYGFSASTSSSSSKRWSFSDPELQRKKRVAGYKVYGVEEKMKGSLRKSFRWVKNTYTQVLHGWW